MPLLATGNAVAVYTASPDFAVLAQIGLVSASVTFVPAGTVIGGVPDVAAIVWPVACFAPFEGEAAESLLSALAP
ncbi:MAG: hypothetical protein DMG36_17655 [Acidobacteria bacterium]|nr:MAG: hypothetical protein DMG36_17655 [Acidobacteriota bacterium]